MGIPQPSTDDGVAGLLAILHRPQQSLLAFDFDGVLSPIVPDPSQSRAHPGAIPALRRLTDRIGSLAIITGRPAATVISLGGFGELVDNGQLTIFGAYGQEFWDYQRGAVVAQEIAPGVASARAELPRLLSELGAPPGVSVEDKGRSLAVHTRRAPESDRLFDELYMPLADLAERHGLALEPGRLVLELRQPGIDKGLVLTRHLRDHGLTSVAYFGDDLGDLPAYGAVETLRRTGIPGLKVCSGSDEAAEVSRRADLIVEGPAGIVAFLTEVADALEGSNAEVH